MRHIEKIKISGTEYNLLGFSSYSFLPASASSWTELYRQGGDNYPWDMTAGHSFTTDTDLFPSLIAEGYPRHLDDYSEAYINKWYASSWNGIVFGLYYDPSNTIIEYGYMNNGNEVNSTEMFGIILDDENRVGWMVLKHCYYPNNPTTVIGCIGGNSEMGQTIYSIFGIPATLSGGAGSGYIGNSLLSNKKMVGYNVPTSSAESTKTESVNEASENPVSGKPKIGNGFARIKFLRDGVTKTLEEVMGHSISQYDTLPVTNIYYFPYSSVDGDNAFWGGSDKRVLQYNASNGYYYYEFRETNYDSADSAIAIAIPRQYIKNVTFKSGIFQTTSHPDCAFGFSPVDTVTETGDNRFWCNYNHGNIQTINVPNVGTYYEFTVEVNGYADYLVFYCVSGEWRMKDFSLVVIE